MSDKNHDFTTLSIHRETHSRLEDMKPYESVSFDEFINVLMDSYEDK